MALSLAFACPACGEAVEGRLDPAANSESSTPEMTCRKCAKATPLPEAKGLAETRAVVACPVCGSADLYQQRDFNRVLGIGLVVVGVLTGPFTHWISTIAFVGLDALLYLFVSPVAICYACEGQIRGFDAKKGPGAFDIGVHDAYRFGKRYPPRREMAVAGPRRRWILKEQMQRAK